MSLPRIAYADLAWMSAFEKVKKLGAGAALGDFKVIYANDDPPWVQVKSKAGKRMVRKGDALIFDLAKASDATLQKGSP